MLEDRQTLHPHPHPTRGRSQLLRWIAGLLLVVTSTLSCLLMDHIQYLNVVSASAGIAAFAVMTWVPAGPPVRCERLLATAALVVALSRGLSIFMPAYWLWLLGVLVATALGLWMLIVAGRALVKRVHRRGLRRTVAAGSITLLSLLVIVAAVSNLTAVAPGPVVTPMAALSIGATKNTRTAQPSESTRPDGSVLHKNVEYGSELPNSYLDIYVRSEGAPTFFYIHGGAFVGGDKAEGDPFAPKGSDQFYFQSLLDAGYNVVSANYVLAPGYVYPTAVKQLAGALTFLSVHANAYGIDMSRVVLAGSSAGGQLAGQLSNIQTDPEYARGMHIAPPLPAGAVKATVFASSLLEPARFAETGEVIVGYGWYQYGRQYFDAGFLQHNARARQADVISHASADFPPTFISDGNSTSFFAQARRMDARLTKLGVHHRLNIYNPATITLKHGFESKDSEYGRKNMAAMLSFLDALPGL